MGEEQQVAHDHQWRLIDSDGKEHDFIANGFNIMGDYVMFSCTTNVVAIYFRPKKFFPILGVEGSA